MTNPDLSPEQIFAARVLDVFGALSPGSLADLRRPEGPRRPWQRSGIPRHALADLAQAFEGVYPGLFDDYVRRVSRG